MGDREVHAATIAILGVIGPVIGQVQAERSGPPFVIDAEEAARLMHITLPAFKQRVARGQIPRAAIYRTGRRVQFIRSKLPGATP